jgi:hypothetical protein
MAQFTLFNTECLTTEPEMRLEWRSKRVDSTSDKGRRRFSNQRRRRVRGVEMDIKGGRKEGTQSTTSITNEHS